MITRLGCRSIFGGAIGLLMFGAMGADRVAGAAGGGRSYQAISNDYYRAFFQYSQGMSGGNGISGFQPYEVSDGRAFGTPAMRRVTASRVIPIINLMLNLGQEMEGVAPETVKKANAESATLCEIIKMGLDDGPSRKANLRVIEAGGKDAPVAVVMRAAADYLASGSDARLQGEAVDRWEKSWKAVGAEAPLTLVPKIFQDNPPADEVSGGLIAFLKSDTHSRFSKDIGIALAGRARRTSIGEESAVDDFRGR